MKAKDDNQLSSRIVGGEIGERDKSSFTASVVPRLSSEEVQQIPEPNMSVTSS